MRTDVQQVAEAFLFCIIEERRIELRGIDAPAVERAQQVLRAYAEDNEVSGILAGGFETDSQRHFGGVAQTAHADALGAKLPQ